MQIADFIERLDKTNYVFAGAATLARPIVRTVSIRAQFEFVRSAESIIVEGGCFQHGDPPLAFTLEVPFATMSTGVSVVQLRSPSIGTFNGQLVSASEGFELLASSPAGALCSMHLQFTSARAFGVAGMFKLSDQSLSFSARETGEWEKANQSKVVVLAKRRA